MRKTLYFVLLIIFCFFAVSGCSSENYQSDSDRLTGKTVKVSIGIGQSVKSFNDSEGIVWSVGDVIKFSGDGIKLTSEPLSGKDIKDGGHHADFSFDAVLVSKNRSGWFYSEKCHPGNDNEVEFTLGNAEGYSLVQKTAGNMNGRYLFLHSGTRLIDISEGIPPVVRMDIAGSIFRAIPYSQKYNDENVLSVSFESSDNVVGTVAYNRYDGTYRGVNDVNWQTSRKILVTLETPFSLSGVTSAESSKGIYMAVAATKSDSPLKGYKFIVETDKARYVFDASDNRLSVGENVVKNYLLNLDKAERITEPGGELRYVGDLNMLSNRKLPASGAHNIDAGYWYAQVKPVGEQNWTNREGVDNEAFYSSVTFSVTDFLTGLPVDWVNVAYPGGGGTHWYVSVEPNNGPERKARITATFHNVKGYILLPEYSTKEIIVTQADAAARKVVEYASVSLPSEKYFSSVSQDRQDVGYCLLKVDGLDDRDWSQNGIYARSRFVAVTEEDYLSKNFDSNSAAGWLKCEYPRANETTLQDCIWLVSAERNDTGKERVGYIVCLFPQDSSYEFPEPKALKVIQQQ